MLTVFPLPDLGEGLTESEIVSWNVKEGDTVALNQVLGEVETAKAVVELPSPFAGVVSALHAGPGEVVEVGKPLVTFEVAGEESAAPAAEGGAERTPTLVGYGAADEAAGSRRRRRGAGTLPSAPRRAEPARVAAAEAPAVEVAPAATVAPAAAQVPVAAVPVAARADRPRSTPPVRKLARDAGLDIALLQGTGPEGLVTRADVQAALALAPDQGAAPTRTTAPGADPALAAPAASGTPVPAADVVQEAGVRTLGGRPRTWDVPVRGVKKATANAMVASMRDQPQVTEFLTVDVTRSMELIAQLKRERGFRDIKLSPLSLVAKAVCIALEREPGLNARWAGESITMQSFVNLGIAAATDRGLVVPNIKDAQALNLLGLCEAINSLAATARAGKTPQANLSGGTFTITNVGVFGVDAGTPILNPGETGILAMGQVRRTPWEHRGEITLREVMTLSLTFDHRVVDGAEGSRFLADVGAILSDPGRTLTMI
ncbi:MAG: 2-oxo acid dehydrogenase subunit E2 [Arthrobacter sp.]|jgi:pyruvate dehydrogenase E2 component (dihydrolipoamide acetyltransferase)|nr:2-oxo acid dehydrogenase subunit E2 [Arthrobacter sp.]